MKIKNCFFIIIFLILMLPIFNVFLNPAASQQIPQNNVPDSQRVSLVGRWAYGPCLAVAVEATGNIACFGNGSYLEIVSLANPSQPSRLSKILLPAPILDIKHLQQLTIATVECQRYGNPPFGGSSCRRPSARRAIVHPPRPRRRRVGFFTCGRRRFVPRLPGRRACPCGGWRAAWP